MRARPVYMDNHSTTRVDPRVLEAMLPFFCEKFGNAASVNHAFGWEAADAVETARSQIGDLINAESKCIVFTSGATESNNLALKGVLQGIGQKSHLIINAGEHKSVLDPASALQREGFEVTILPVDRYGMIDPGAIAAAIHPKTVLVSAMFANNEVGTINPIHEIGRTCRERGVLFHVDAAQAVGKIAIDMKTMPIDLLSISAHKMYGPKGIGALYVRSGTPRIRINPLLDGGGHERRFRSGTLAVPLIVGFGSACELCRHSLSEESQKISVLRDRLLKGLREQIDGVELNGHPELRLPGNANVRFQGVNSEALMMHLKDVLAVSSGSACTTADPEPSHVLVAMGIPEDQIESTIRFGLGRFNSDDDVNSVLTAVRDGVTRLRQIRAH